MSREPRATVIVQKSARAPGGAYDSLSGSRENDRSSDRPTVRSTVRPSDRPSVRPTVRPSVRSSVRSPASGDNFVHRQNAIFKSSFDALNIVYIPVRNGFVKPVLNNPFWKGEVLPQK